MWYLFESIGKELRLQGLLIISKFRPWPRPEKLFERCVSMKHVFHIFVSFMNFLSGKRLQK